MSAPTTGGGERRPFLRPLALGILLVGSLQMVGDITGLPALKGLAAATQMSPAPRVFSSVKGLETYSTRFFLEGAYRDGRPFSIELTPRVYARLRGPYNRRNVYGAVLAYGPIMAGDPLLRPMYAAVMEASLCGDAPLLSELGLAQDVRRGSLRVRCEPRPGTDLGELPRILEVRCP